MIAFYFSPAVHLADPSALQGAWAAGHAPKAGFSGMAGRLSSTCRDCGAEILCGTLCGPCIANRFGDPVPPEPIDDERWAAFVGAFA